MTSKLKLLLACTAIMVGIPASSQTPAATNGLEIAKKMIAFRSVRGPGNQTPQLAAYLKQTLVAGGFAAADVTI
ncbi:hypothetical protein AB2D03_34775, partial [Pseudomonas aeruginosa]